jgi:hypothetical protein
VKTNTPALLSSLVASKPPISAAIATPPAQTAQPEFPDLADRLG